MTSSTIRCKSRKFLVSRFRVSTGLARIPAGSVAARPTLTRPTSTPRREPYTVSLSFACVMEKDSQYRHLFVGVIQLGLFDEELPEHHQFSTHLGYHLVINQFYRLHHRSIPEKLLSRGYLL